LVNCNNHRSYGNYFISPVSEELVDIYECVYCVVLTLVKWSFRFRITVTPDDFKAEFNYTIRSIPIIYYAEGNLPSILPQVIMMIIIKHPSSVFHASDFFDSGTMKGMDNFSCIE